MKTKKRDCSQRVFSGARWDMGGHMCGLGATVERNGKHYCKKHDPVAVAARREATDAKDAARRREDDAMHAEADALSKALGIKPCGARWSNHTGRPSPFIVISFDEAKALAARIKS